MIAAIQNARSEDAADIAGVHIASLRAAYRGLIPDHLIHLVLDPLDARRRTRGWRHWLQCNRVNTVVARVDGAVVGFCALHPMRDSAVKRVTGEISAIFVHPSHWRRGIGHLLCQQILAQARARGLPEVALWVLDSNQRARGFYRSLGFCPDGDTRVFLERSGTAWYELRYRRSTSHAVA